MHGFRVKLRDLSEYLEYTKNPSLLGMVSASANSDVYCKPSTRCLMTSRPTPCPPHCCEWTLRADLSELHQPSPLVWLPLGSAEGGTSRRLEAGKERLECLPLLTNNANKSFGLQIAMAVFLC